MTGDHVHEDRRVRRNQILFILLIVGLAASAGLLAFFLPGHTRDLGISVIRMEGTIVTGDGIGDGYIGSEYVGRQLRNAADDPMVDAIVLRVNSPGGTPAGAQEIARDMRYARDKKPIVVSMGDIATSSAYYVSAYASRIYADPDTLTGGIGTSWTFLDISGWMAAENLSVEVVKSGSRKDMGSQFRALTPEERDYAQEIVNESFERFITDVLAERPVDRAAIEDARVFRGEQAHEIGLVDEIGNLQDAIAGAKSLAK